MYCGPHRLDNPLATTYANDVQLPSSMPFLSLHILLASITKLQHFCVSRGRLSTEPGFWIYAAFPNRSAGQGSH